MVIKISDIFKLKTTGLDKVVNDNETLVKMVNFMDVYNGNNDISTFSFTSGTKSQIENNKINNNDIIITLSSENQHDIFESLVIENINNEDIVYSYHVCCLRLLKKDNPYYYHYLFQNKQFKKEMSKLSCGSTRYVISKTDFSNTTIHIHENIETRNLIGCFFKV